MESAPTNPLPVRLRPPRPARGVIARPRLDSLLELVRARTLTVVKAPPGYGKTTMAQSWAEVLAGDGARVAWLALSADDDDDERFFAALSAALRQACAAETFPAADVALGELSIPLRHRIDWLLAELATHPGDLFVVLDDYHEINRPSIHLAMAAHLCNAPAQLHLVLLSRTTPPLDLTSLRARDAVLELDAQMLRFDLAETHQLLRKNQSETIDPNDAARLHEMTGGWVAALRAALLSARINGGTARYVRGTHGTPRSVNAFFGDLLEHFPPDLLRFMEQTSVAERLCADLATRLTGRTDAQALLEDLERRQVFIAALDESQQWFAFHRLFRETLLRRAQRDPDLPTVQHEKAAAWCAEKGQWTDAIGHALAAGANAQALDWIERHAMAVVGAGDLLTLLAWERQLRAHLIESPLRLRLAFAWGLGLAMACDKALVLLDGVEAQIATQPAAEQAALRCECLALRSVVVCTTGDYEMAAALAAQCSTDVPHPPWVANALRNVAAAMSLHSGRWKQLFVAPPVHGDTRGSQQGDSTATVYRLSIRGLAELRQGHLDEADALLTEALRAGAVSPTLAALPAPTLALVRYLQDRAAEAAEVNTRHMEINRRVAPIEGLYATYLVAARLARLDGETIRARHLLDECESVGAARGWRRVEMTMLLEKVRLCLLDRRLAEAGACAARIEAMATHARTQLDRTDFGRAAELARAWCDLADGRAARAGKALAALATSAREEGRLVDAVGVLGALALAREAGGDTDGANTALREASALVHTTGALRALLDQPLPLAPLVSAALLTAISDPHRADYPWFEPVLRRAASARRERSAEPARTHMLERLSPREHHILTMLAHGRSNKEIARGLGIAPETVKSHVSRIFAKLGAQNRAQAAAMINRP